MNFIVSFGLSILLAFRSRNIPFKETRELAWAVLKYFKSFPMEFFIPTGNTAEVTTEKTPDKK